MARARDGRRRAVIENLSPGVDGGRFPIKRCTGDTVVVEADAFVDGHDSPRVLLLHRRRGERRWQETEMSPLGNDRWRAEFPVDDIGLYEYTVTAWADHFLTWRRDLDRWTDAADIAVALEVGAQLLAAAAGRARGADARRLEAWARDLSAPADPLERRELAHDAALVSLASRYPDRSEAVTFEPALPVRVDPLLARFSAWYELFPRSATDDASPRAHGTFRDVEKRLDYVASLGFDVLYLPPIHPIGRERRKGRNNAVTAAPDEPGSPWAIGAREGGHKAVHPQLGTAGDFRSLVAAAKRRGIAVALDIAFQCAPDHPYVKDHPDWFRHRPDGSVQYAENPPKKYQDIYPLNFECEDWRALWEELKSVFLHWIGEGVQVFRVDNPHTKPFAFWEWVIAEIKAGHPQVIFLSEAFTRPKVMHRLAKLGFSQSYTYFTWRNTKHELTEYFTELSRHPSREYFRPNVWPNTPDILHEFLQHGGRPAFMIRLVLAATLSASYGVYGPAYELTEHVAREAGSEEYLDSEKYQVRRWNLDSPDSIKNLMGTVNRIRRQNVALQGDWNLRFHPVDNDLLLFYSKATADLGNVILVAVNLDTHHVQSGWVQVPVHELGIDPSRPYEVHDLLTGARYTWNGSHNYVQLDPHALPAHVFRIERLRDERDYANGTPP